MVTTDSAIQPRYKRTKPVTVSNKQWTKKMFKIFDFNVEEY